MKYLFIILLAGLSIKTQAGQESYTCKNAKISLYGSSPLNDIKAVTTAGISTFDAATGELSFSVAITTFQFEKQLMQQHFNSEYMESDKFPMATFKGKIKEHIDVAKDGIYPITVTGDLTIHGVTKKRTIQGKVDVKGGLIKMTSEFIVKDADHNVKIPKMVFHKFAEAITMNVSATYSAR